MLLLAVSEHSDRDRYHGKELRERSDIEIDRVVDEIDERVCEGKYTHVSLAGQKHRENEGDYAEEGEDIEPRGVTRLRGDNDAYYPGNEIESAPYHVLKHTRTQALFVLVGVHGAMDSRERATESNGKARADQKLIKDGKQVYAGKTEQHLPSFLKLHRSDAYYNNEHAEYLSDKLYDLCLIHYLKLLFFIRPIIAHPCPSVNKIF